MSDISRVALFGKLNSLAYQAVESATVFCKLRGNPYVELVHWIHQILQLQTSDLHCIVRALDLDAGRLARDLPRLSTHFLAARRPSPTYRLTSSMAWSAPGCGQRSSIALPRFVPAMCCWRC